MRDDAGWASDPTTVQAAPANGDVWAYNVAAGNTPLIIVKLNNIRWIPTGQSETALTGDYYLTVTGYDNISTFVAGQVYRVGMINTGTGDSDFLFTPDNLGTEPNEEEVELTLNVTNVGWTLNTNRPVFGK